MSSIWGDLLQAESMADTPARVLRHWIEITKGLQQDPALPLEKTFPCDHDDLVIVRDIPFTSLCEHHLLPFYGKAHVAYIPQGRVVGLSKIPRSLDILARRPQLQERLSNELADIIEQVLQPSGVAVILAAEHSCMTSRGVLKPGSMTVTSALRGVFRHDIAARAEIMRLIQ